MATLREVQNRIRAVKSTRRITRAMEMVAAAKLRKAQQRVEQAKPYARKLDETLAHLASASTGELAHPLFEERPVAKKTLILVTADRGLCGSFNSNIIRKGREWLANLGETEGELVVFGKKGWEFFRKETATVLDHHIEWGEEVDYQAARSVVKNITNRFLSGDTDQVDVLFTRFISMGRFEVALERFLPIARPEQTEDDEGPAIARDYIFEPTPEAIYEQLLPYYTTTKLITVITESFASELASRMLAMNAATKAAGDMIDSLTLLYNKARQSQITTEITEVVSGAEALKG